MLQKIITLCDVHAKTEPPTSVDADTYVVTFDDGVGYSLDLCRKYFEIYAKPFYDLVMICGRARERKPRKIKVRRRRSRKRAEVRAGSRRDVPVQSVRLWYRVPTVLARFHSSGSTA